MKAFPALKKLVDICKVRAKIYSVRELNAMPPEQAAEVRKTMGTLKGLDGRRIPIRSAHSALNTLLQSAGAIIMKKALVILDDNLRALGFIPGVHYEFVGNIHDEWQISCNPDIAEVVGQTAAEAIRLAGEALNFRCPLKGNYDIGPNWAATH
jgi:DNA polymerase I-like protein with 3'-5' exonuclease and polymerase domains